MRNAHDDALYMQNKQVQYGSKAMTFFIYHAGDPRCPVNPFIGCPNAAQVMAGQNTPDMVELNRWTGLLQPGLAPHVYLVPTMFCGDDGATTNNTAFHEFFLPAALWWLDKYSVAYNIASEANKTMSVIQMQNMIAFMKKHTNKPIGVHLQWDRKSNLPGNADFLMYEFSWHPKDGNNYSVQNVITEAAEVMTKSPMPVWFQEMNCYPESVMAKAQSAAILQNFPQCAGLPGPIN